MEKMKMGKFDECEQFTKSLQANLTILSTIADSEHDEQSETEYTRNEVKNKN